MSSSSRPTRRHDKLQVLQVMNSVVPVAPPSTSVDEAHRILEQHSSRYLLIVESDEVVGIVGPSDLAAGGREAPVSSCMRAPVLGICERASVDEAARLMHETGLGCLPAFAADGRLLGVVTRNEVHSVQ